MKVLVIQPKIGMGDMIIYLPYIHAISKHYRVPVSILVKDNSRARDLLNDDEHIDEILSLADRIVVMFDGQLVGEKINKNLTDKEIGLLMAGITN